MRTKHKIITLRHLVINGKKMIGMEFKVDPLIQKIIKTLDNPRWSNTYNMAFIDNTNKNLDMIFAVFRGVAWINGKYFYKDKAINDNIEEPDFSSLKRKKGNRSVCPESFIDKLQLKRYSKRTAILYIKFFEDFINYYRTKNLMEINEKDITEYLKYLQSKNYSASYQNQAINAIKFYYEIVEGLPNRFYYIDRPRVASKLPSILSAEEVKLLLSQPTNIKHKALLSILYSSGMRIGELIDLKILDIDSKRNQIHIRGAKGDKDRYTILSGAALDILREYYKDYKPKEFLFEGPNGGRYSRASVNKIIKSNAKRAKILKNVTPHTLRHSFATHLLDNGTDIRYIQSLLGHKSAQTTEIYTHITTRSYDNIQNPLDIIM